VLTDVQRQIRHPVHGRGGGRKIHAAAAT
jgi:hypothetical protein